jgi:hypothetical protein
MMKNTGFLRTLVSLLLIIMLVFGLLPVGLVSKVAQAANWPYGADMVANGSFEQTVNNFPQSWTPMSTVPSSSLTMDTSLFSHGVRGLKIADTAGSCSASGQISCGVGVFSAPIAIRYGETYTAEVKANVSQGEIFLLVRTRDANGNEDPNQQYFTKATQAAGWQTLSVTFTPPESYSSTAVIRVYERPETAPTAATIDEVAMRLSGNLAHNGGFEIVPGTPNGFPVGWVPMNNAAPSSVTTVTASANVSAGTRSIKLVDDSGGEPYADVGLKTQPIAIRPGETFDIKVKVKVDEGKVTVLARSFNGSGIEASQAAETRTAADGWQTIAFSYTPVEPYTSTLVLMIYGRDDDNSDGTYRTTAYIDEVSVTSNELLFNPSFEAGAGTLPDGWNVFVPGNTTPGSAAWVTAMDSIDHGGKAVRITQSANSALQLQSIPVKHKLVNVAGVNYGATFTVTVKAKVITGKAALTIQPMHWGGIPLDGYAVAVQSTAAGWQTLQATIKPPNWSPTLRVVLSTDGASADVVFDSVEMRFGWPITSPGDKSMPFRPADQASSEQNPPDFSWSYVDFAQKYELQIASDASFDTIEYSNDEIPVNVFNLPHTLDTGKDYYWRVRYYVPQGWSAWSDTRKFGVKSSAYAFTVPDIETMIGTVTNERPRILTTSSTLEAFKLKKDNVNVGKPIFDFAKQRVDDIIARNSDANPNNDNNPPSEPTANLWDHTYGETTTILAGALMYLITEEPNYLAFTKSRLMNIIDWDPNGTTSYQNEDRVSREIALAEAVAYDWLKITSSGAFTDAERGELLTAIHTRTQTIYDDILNEASLYRSPYHSHGWTAAGYVAIIATAMMHETATVNGVSMNEAAKEWFRKAVPVRINMYPPIGGEQGGWATGTGYWEASHLSDKRVADVLKSAAGVNLYDKAFSKNEQNLVPYFWPVGSPVGNFGDGAENPMSEATVNLLRRQAEIYTNPIAQWSADAASVTLDRYKLFSYAHGNNVGKRPPFELPSARWQKDVGWVAMHSSLYDPQRISLYFISSPYGSYNHSHADQNSFTINAFGEKLAIDAGYYDGYGTPFHENYYRTTMAHNAITYDGNKGQKIDDLNASGRIAGFASSQAFDGTVGDATAAYNQDSGSGLPGLDLARRGIIYVKPEAFVVIDKLDAKGTANASFEYLLHSDSNMTLTGQEATIEKNQAAMKARIQYPAILNGAVNSVIPDWPVSKPVQRHAKFTFPSASAQTIISTFQPYRAYLTPAAITTQTHLNSNQQPSYQSLTFADGTIVYVRLAGSGLVTVNSNFKFDGMAAAVRGSNVLLLDGVRLEKDGIALLQTSVPATIALSGSEISISGDAPQLQVQVNTTATTLVDETYAAIPSGGTAAAGMSARGVHWTKSGDVMTIQSESGRHFWLTGKSAPGSQQPGVKLKVKLNGTVIGEHVLAAHGTYYGGTASYGQLTSIATVPAGSTYTIANAPAGLRFEKGGAATGTKTFTESPWVILDGAGGTLPDGTLDGGTLELTN